MTSTSTRPAPLLTQTGVRRRTRLRDLERDVAPSVWEERRRAARAVLANPLLVDPGGARALVVRHKDWLQLWFAHHVGWDLIVDASRCRLYKRPAHTGDDSRPCRDPGSKETALTRRGYIFICLILSILVREGRQLTLRRIAEELAGIGKTDPAFDQNGVALELDRRETRRDLVQALRVLLEWHVISRVDGSEEGYVASDQVDVLYAINRPVLSSILAARQPPSLVTTGDHERRLNEIWLGPAAASDSDDSRSREIRYGIFRRLLDDPVLYYADLDEATRAYLDKQRPSILKEIEKATGLIPEVRAEGIAMVDPLGDLSDFSLPESGTDGHLTLLLATSLADHLRAGNGDPIPLTLLENETRALAAKHNNWRKDARNPGSEVTLTRDAIARLRALGLVRAAHGTVTPLPAIGRFGLREPLPEPAEPQQPSLL